jgi:Icc-related predicted phosphoesterase
MRIWHISETHGNHDQLVVPEGVDLVIHSGDASNYRDPFRNEPELRAFIDWFASLPIPNKVFVPGNHDTSLEKGLITRELIEGRGIHLLLDEEREICGLRVWGSPITPRYGDWAYMRDRGVTNRVWSEIPVGVDVVVTHGPPYGVLDATYSRGNQVELCGDSALMKRIADVQPRLMCFGHIHSTKDIRNAGTRQVHGLRTTFSNGSIVDDGKWGVATGNGNVLELGIALPLTVNS